MELPLENRDRDVQGMRYALQTDVSTFMLFLWTTTATGGFASPAITVLL